MSRSSPASAARERRFRLAWLGCLLAIAAPVVVLLACLALRFGVVPLATALDLITLTIAWPLSWVGVAGAALAVRGWRGAGRGGWLPALIAVVAAGATLGLFIWHFQKAGATSAPDVTSNVEDPPGFSEGVIEARRAAGAVATDRWADDRGSCEGLASWPGQVAPGVAGYALQEAGFQIGSLGVGRATGVRSGLWFGRTYDAVVRIRPGRTDVRVTARSDRATDEGEACRLARAVVANLG